MLVTYRTFSNRARMSPYTISRELVAAALLTACYPLDLIAPRQSGELLSEEGDAPVLLAHGLGGNRTNLLGLAAFLQMAGLWNLVFFEYPRHQSVADSVSQLGSLVGKVAPQGGAHLIGHSLGGTIMRQYVAETRSGSVRSLVTMGSPYSLSQASPNELAIFGEEDPIVTPPPEHARPGMFKRTVVLPYTGHFSVLYDLDAMRLAADELRANRPHD